MPNGTLAFLLRGEMRLLTIAAVGTAAILPLGPTVMLVWLVVRMSSKRANPNRNVLQI